MHRFYIRCCPRLTDGLKAQERAKPDASAIYVPGNQTAQAIEEAIEAEIPLVVAVAEHVPVHDMLRVRDSYTQGEEFHGERI